MYHSILCIGSWHCYATTFELEFDVPTDVKQTRFGWRIIVRYHKGAVLYRPDEQRDGRTEGIPNAQYIY